MLWTMSVMIDFDLDRPPNRIPNPFPLRWHKINYSFSPSFSGHRASDRSVLKTTLFRPLTSTQSSLNFSCTKK